LRRDTEFCCAARSDLLAACALSAPFARIVAIPRAHNGAHQHRADPCLAHKRCDTLRAAPGAVILAAAGGRTRRARRYRVHIFPSRTPRAPLRTLLSALARCALRLKHQLSPRCACSTARACQHCCRLLPPRRARARASFARRLAARISRNCRAALPAPPLIYRHHYTRTRAPAAYTHATLSRRIP